jgi:hypothetical protein
MRSIGPSFAVLSLLVASALACGTHLSALDTRALQNQQRAAVGIDTMTDSGVVKSLSAAVYCGSGAILKRAGQSAADGGVIPCP